MDISYRMRKRLPVTTFNRKPFNVKWTYFAIVLCRFEVVLAASCLGLKTDQTFKRGSINLAQGVASANSLEFIFNFRLKCTDLIPEFSVNYTLLLEFSEENGHVSNSKSAHRELLECTKNFHWQFCKKQCICGNTVLCPSVKCTRWFSLNVMRFTLNKGVESSMQVIIKSQVWVLSTPEIQRNYNG